MRIDNLRDLFLTELKDLYSAEHQILKALPKLRDKAGNDALKNAFEEHLDQTQQQVERLDEIFRRSELKPESQLCKGIQGILEEGEDVVKQAKDPSIRDAGIIASAQRVEHYEIAAYGTARTYAKLLGDDRAVSLLEKTLEEEKQADRKLTELAVRGINVEASRK